ncbi:UPF0364 protein C6orf211-like protein [Sarcoptes scabiei]|uniref:Sugar phosphate phosphatase n=1 Tax=Sarcoptes scabiei TaxID=52283 RepID=A0A132A2H2_SARSC|nr:UPF0364 protein C6orf211-like protein [Sarcoptes scabiei]
MTQDNEIPPPLSAKIKESFAFTTLSYRVPVIITKVIDYLCRQRLILIQQLNITSDQKPLAEEEIKSIIQQLACIKYLLVTNKSLTPIVSDLSDAQIWNDYFQEQSKIYDELVYFEISWLYAECYVYRSIRECFAKSKFFQNFDPFFETKQESFKFCLDISSQLAKHLQTLENQSLSDCDSSEIFRSYLMSSLWGNKFDLSLSCGENHLKKNIDSESLESKILINDLDDLWRYILKSRSKKTDYRIDFVFDNAGYELFADLCFVHSLRIAGILPITKVNFYVKKMPWFVSDTMKSDLNWLLDFLDQKGDQFPELRQLSTEFQNNFSKGIWKIQEEDFWTTPHDFSQMLTISPDLYRNLSESDLIIFKGDLNYRKLVGDLQWSLDTEFKRSLRNFQPKTAICSLRTIKADVVVGIKNKETLERVKGLPSDWMLTGEYALISFLDNHPE